LRTKEFAKTGMKVSDIGVGTYYDPLWIATAFLGWKRGAASKIDAVKTAIEAGVTLVDTAEIYQSEPLVGEAIRNAKRDDLFVATKVWSNHLHGDALTRAFEKSLKRLGLSYIDLYQVHWPNPRVPMRETMSAMEELIAAGKLKHVGVSNFSLEQIKEAQESLRRAELSSVQLDYSLIHRNVEADILPHCDRERIALLAYYPLGHGKLVRDQRLGDAAVKYQKSKAQVALGWLAKKENVFPIPRASRANHVRENAAAGDFDLSDSDVAELEKRFQ